MGSTISSVGSLDPIDALDAAQARVGAAERALLAAIVLVEPSRPWLRDGARDLPHWLSMRYGLSDWKARRLIVAAHALEGLPRLASALERDHIGLDKVLELARFAEPSDEARLIRWAQGASTASVRRRADREQRSDPDQVTAAEADRCVHWWYEDEGRGFGLEAHLPAAAGAAVVRAIDRLAQRIPRMPGEDAAPTAPARRADALVALCGASIAVDPDPDRATVVVHAQLEVLASGQGHAEVEDGPVLPAQAAGRLLCNARIQTVVEDPSGRVVQISSMRREPQAWMLRQVRHRDLGCVFPGCGTKAYTEAHHIRFWRHGGRTDLDNLALICSFHHRLVHEHGWNLRRAADGTVEWHRPDGRRHLQPREAADGRTVISSAAARAG